MTDFVFCMPEKFFIKFTFLSKSFKTAKLLTRWHNPDSPLDMHPQGDCSSFKNTCYETRMFIDLQSYTWS